MGSLVTAAQAAYQAWQESKPSSIGGWDDLTDAEIASLFRDEQKYLQAIADAQMIEQSFYDARAQAFADYEATCTNGRVALQTAWQSYEDDMFTIPAGV